jgi:hypothetical protein
MTFIDRASWCKLQDDIPSFSIDKLKLAQAAFVTTINPIDMSHRTIYRARVSLREVVWNRNKL